ncbi:MAG: TrkH family potassium uptake protein [Saprospiraceae bacterium]|jgi:trk system potassium uptake protein TrkH
MIHTGIIFRVLGFLLLPISLLMFSSLPVCFILRSGDELAMLFSGLICAITGGLLVLFSPRKNPGIRKREGYLIVVSGWIVMALSCMLPYLFSGEIPNVADAIFETVSGLTTTGASVLTDIEGVSQGILYWRSMTHWIGGMGIIVLTVAIFPLLGIGGIELFVAEAPGPTSEKLHPRIQETAKRLWLIYVGLTAILVLLLKVFGMSWYDAVNHSYATMATGGFSTRNASIDAFPSLPIQYTLILFMFLAGSNFTVLYLALKGKMAKVWKNDEFRAYLIFTLFVSLLIAAHLWRNHGYALEPAFRDSLFMVVSVLTTTGFVTADYTQWGNAAIMVFFILLFIGGCAGSTAGGIKIIRNLVFIKNSWLEFKRIIHPRAIVPLKISGEVVAPKIMTHIIIFLLLYLMVFLMGAIFLAGLGYDFMTSMGAAVTCLSNVGPGIGKVGPVDNFGWMSDTAKLILSVLMLLGRLEIFTILVLFTPFFWKSH